MAAAVLAGLAGLAACADRQPTRIDGSTPETFAATVEQARDELPVADRIAFDEAINTVPARRYANRDPERLARTSFDGMTAAEVVAAERRRQAQGGGR